MPHPPETASHLPPLSPSQRLQLKHMEDLLRVEIARAGGALAFDRYMELALYAPGLGYYVAGARKFGQAGDFVTAPELSPLFSRCLARQCSEVLRELGGGDILELGAGAGTMAVDLLLELETLGLLPTTYWILELSPELQARQRAAFTARAPGLLNRVRWCERLPGPDLRGLVLANEMLDAMPVHRFRIVQSGVEELFVVVECADGLASAWRPAVSPGLVEAVAEIENAVGGLPSGYASEVNLRLGPWLRALGAHLLAGLVLLIDYGYTRREFYHPERRAGTLLCHYRHRVHDDALILPGLQDITANVDFTAVAAAGAAAGFRVEGYATQAHFLLGCGLDTLLSGFDPGDVAAHLKVMQGVKKLTLPGEMGERFKVIGLGRGLGVDLCGFRMRNLRDRL